MKLKYRLAVAFLIIVVVPLLFVGVGILVLGRSNPSGYIGTVFRFSNTVDEIREFSNDGFKMTLEMVDENPDMFLDVSFLARYNEEINRNYSAMVVKRNGREIFNGTERLFGSTITILPGLTKNMGHEGALYLMEDDVAVLVRKADTVFSDGYPGEILFVTDGNALLPNSRRVILDTLVSITIILIFTAAIMILWIYNSVISKVNRLIHGANNIKNGDLDFSIATKGSDELSELVNTFEDMKERLRRDSEEKLRAETEQRELISNIAHDLKTPLTAIKGYAEGIIDGVADTDEKKMAYVRTIGKKAEELNILLNELTVYSNISTNRIPYNFRHINVRRYFLDLAEEFYITYERVGVGREYHIDVDEDMEMIADPEQLRRVIENIIDNSIKYKGDNDPFVSFRVRALEGFIQVEIEDNGRGISSDDLPYIFDRMYRADASRNTSIGGSGIGLSIAKKIIEDHGGKIWATSRLGEGACFYFIIRQYEPPKDTEDTDNAQKNTDNRRRRSHSRT